MLKCPNNSKRDVCPALKSYTLIPQVTILMPLSLVSRILVVQETIDLNNLRQLIYTLPKSGNRFDLYLFAEKL
jgi:predicted nucleotidyltransferase